MRFENTFDVAAAPAAVFDTMLDIPRVAGCLPGATVGDRGDDGAYTASMAVKVGPIRMTYGGTVAVTEHDASLRRAVMLARGKEQRGQGTAQATITMSVGDADGGSGSHVEMITDLMVTGRVAQMGQGIMQEVANTMVARFSDCLAARLGGSPSAAEAAAGRGPPAAPQEVSAMPLLMRAIAARIRGLFRRS